MIRHLLRQEKVGGYWLIRDEGRAIELDQAGYALMASLHASGGRPDDAGHGRLRESVRRQGGGSLLAELGKYHLDQPAAWRHVRHLPSDVPLETLPDDAVIAPKRIYFEITRECNLACRSCFNNSHFKLPGELTLAEILGVNRQAYELGVFEIRYTGGECTIVPGFGEVIADARRRGFYISIGTNGVYTDEQLEWLPASGIDWFIISLDGGRESNDRVRGAGTFDRVLQTLERLALYPAIKVRLNMVVARHNIQAIEAVARLAAEYGAGTLNLIPLRPYGRSVKKMTRDMFSQGDFYDFIREVNRLRPCYPDVKFSTTIDLLDPEATTSQDLIVQKKRTCAAGVEACVVGPLGHVYGCSYSPASFPDSADEEGWRLFVAGDLRQDDLRAIWRDSGRWNVFRDLSLYKNPRCHACRHYTVRCSGSCQIMAWYQRNALEESGGGRRQIADFYDPYCFVDLLEAEGGRSIEPTPSVPGREATG
jgi:radical SAM protein with 4Fe4S-binding SPASM domain